MGILDALTGFVLGGGLVSAIVAFTKLRPERDAIVVSTSAANIQSATQLVAAWQETALKAAERAERAERRVAELEAQVAELCRRLRDLERQRGGNP